MALLHLESLPPRTSKGDILQFLSMTGGVSREKVGRIDLRGAIATVEVPADWVVRLVKALDGAALKERYVRARSMAASDLPSEKDSYFQRLSRLLELESKAEARQTLESLRRLSPPDAEHTGKCLIGLVIIDEDTGLGGRCILTFAKRNRSQPLPWNRLEPGAPVLLFPEDAADAEGQPC